MAHNLRILAFDPGFERLGVAVVEKINGKWVISPVGRKLNHCSKDTIQYQRQILQNKMELKTAPSSSGQGYQALDLRTAVRICPGLLKFLLIREREIKTNFLF